MTDIDLTNTLAILDRLTSPIPPAVAAVREAIDDLSHAITATMKKDQLLAKRASESR